MILPSRFFKCLSDETRCKLVLLLLQEGELCVCELTHALDESQPKISRHLAQLRNCNLLSDRRQGQWVYYSIKPQLDSWEYGLLDAFRSHQGQYIQPEINRLHSMGDRPQRQQSCC